MNGAFIIRQMLAGWSPQLAELWDKKVEPELGELRDIIRDVARQEIRAAIADAKEEITNELPEKSDGGPASQ